MALTEELRNRTLRIAHGASFDELTEGLQQAWVAKRDHIDSPTICGRLEEMIDIFLDEIWARRPDQF